MPLKTPADVGKLPPLKKKNGGAEPSLFWNKEELFPEGGKLFPEGGKGTF